MSNNLTNKNSGVSVASLVCAIVSFFINPLSLLPTVALILGIVGLATANGRPKSCAVWGIILSVVAGIFQIVVDLILSIFTFGLSFLF